MAEKGLAVGQAAPDFALKDQHEAQVSLAGLTGKVVLSFHPLAWTPVCTVQMQDLEKHRAEFERLNAVALGISVDSVPCKKAWAGAIGVKETPILADFWPHGGVARSYGVFREQDGFAERTVFVLDESHVIRFHKLYDTGQVPDIQEILDAVAAMESVPAL